VQVTCRGAFAYAAGVLPGGQAIPLFRLRYGGSAHSFGFALYTSRERYEDALLLTGYPTGTPQEALDTACTVNLAGLGHEPDSEPSTNLRRCPLSLPGGEIGAGTCAQTESRAAWRQRGAEAGSSGATRDEQARRWPREVPSSAACLVAGGD